MNEEIDIFSSDQPKSEEPQSPQPVSELVALESGLFCRHCYMLMALCFVFAFFAFRGCIPENIPIPDPGPKPTPIAVDKASVLFAIDGDKDLTPEQSVTTLSQRVHEYCDDNGIEIRRYDVRDDLSRVEPQWQKMMDAAKQAGPPNVVIVTKDGNGRVKDIPSIDSMLEILEGIK